MEEILAVKRIASRPAACDAYYTDMSKKSEYRLRDPAV